MGDAEWVKVDEERPDGVYVEDPADVHDALVDAMAVTDGTTLVEIVTSARDVSPYAARSWAGTTMSSWPGSAPVTNPPSRC